jgi:integrase
VWDVFAASQQPLVAPSSASVTLRIKDQGSGPIIYARWRHEGRPVERRVGRGWFVPAGHADAKSGGDTIGKWTARRGRAPEGLLTKTAALGLVPSVVETWRSSQTTSMTPEQHRAAQLREQARLLEEEARRLEGDQQALFRAAAEAWYCHVRDVKRLKRSTLEDHRTALDARILPVLGPEPLTWLGVGTLIAFRDGLARVPNDNADDDSKALKARTVNKYLIIVGAILNFACRSIEAGGFGLPSNPAREVDKLGEGGKEDIEVLTPAEIVAVAAALKRGAHRKAPRVGVGKRTKGRNTKERTPSGAERARMTFEDARDACAVLIAGFAGLRRSELVGLRRRRVSLLEGRIDVRRAIVNGWEDTPKSGEGRETLVTRLVAQAIAELDDARRVHAELAGIAPAMGDDDFLLGNALGNAMDPSALVRRYKKACAAIGLRVIKFHGLRHSFVTAAREGFSADRVQQLAGHEDPRTAQGYAHPRSRADDADRLSDQLDSLIAADDALALLSRARGAEDEAA